MIVAEARVLRCDARHLWLDVRRPGGGCASCGSQSSCSTSVLASFFSSREPVPLRVPLGDGPLRLPGETVRVGIREKQFLRGSLLLYLLPLIGLIGGALLGQALANHFPSSGNETAAILGGLSGLSGAFWWIGHRSRTRAIETAPEVVILDDAPSVRAPPPRH